MRYLLVDHITGVEPDKSIRGVKNVAMTEDFLEFHFPRNPIMPGVMVLEALAQLTGWLSAVSSDFEQWFVIGNIRQCKYYGFAFPGDQVELEVSVFIGETPSISSSKALPEEITLRRSKFRKLSVANIK